MHTAWSAIDMWAEELYFETRQNLSEYSDNSTDDPMKEDTPCTDILMPESEKRAGGGSVTAPVILCDFDGTISKQDVSDTIFTMWLGEKWSQIDQEWHDGHISMVELYEKCWELVRASEADIGEFVDTVEIDPFFAEFICESRTRDVPVFLVSDGFDYFIDRVIDRFQISGLTYYANHLSFIDGHLTLGFNNQHEDCIQCANCKKAVMDKKREGADYVVYIGNGLSDRCAAEHADLVFAKDSLLKYCKDNGIDCIQYENFGEIIGHLRTRSIFNET